MELVKDINIHYHVDHVPIPSLGPSPDKRWTYIDAAGHQHRYTDDSKVGYAGGHYPTLKWVVDETYWCADCNDEHEDGHTECVMCGEHISPGMVYNQLFVPTIPGQTDARVQLVKQSYDGRFKVEQEWVGVRPEFAVYVHVVMQRDKAAAIAIVEALYEDPTPGYEAPVAWRVRS